MTEQNPAPESDNSASAPVGSDKPDDHRIPKARLDEEVAKRRALEDQVAHMANAMLAGIPENLKALIPSELAPAAQVAWFLRAKETGVFGAASVVVPGTDEGKPKITPKEADISTLPAVARMAHGYKGMN